jgi:hypothetical protein
VIQFAESLSATGIEAQRERLAALAELGGSLRADHAAAGELARHYALLAALFRRLLIDAARLTDSPRSADAAGRLLDAALKAQRASLACLSALKTIRDTAAFTLPTTLRETVNRLGQT